MKHIISGKIAITAIILLLVVSCGGKKDPLMLFPLGGPPAHPSGKGGPADSPEQPPANEDGTTPTPAPIQISVDSPADTNPPPDAPPPPFALVGVSPDEDAVNVSLNAPVIFTFNRKLDCGGKVSGPVRSFLTTQTNSNLMEGWGIVPDWPDPVPFTNIAVAGLQTFRVDVECKDNRIILRPRHDFAPGFYYFGAYIAFSADGMPLRFRTAFRARETYDLPAGGPDRPLALRELSPKPGALNVSPDITTITARFNRNLDCDYVNSHNHFVTSGPHYGQDYLFGLYHAPYRADGRTRDLHRMKGVTVNCSGDRLVYKLPRRLKPNSIYAFKLTNSITLSDHNIIIRDNLADVFWHRSYFFKTGAAGSGGNGGGSGGGDGGDNGDTNDDVTDHGPAPKCEGRTIALDTSKGRWFETPAGEIPHHKRANKKVRVKGIHTYWANQKLYLRVRDNCKAGWYKLKINAKNIHGPLPDFYSRFNVTVKNEDGPLGGIVLKAADNRYHGGSLLVCLPEGDSNLELVWTNDAYKKGVYDANIQIKRVRLKYKRYVRKKKKLVRRGHQYCDVNGRWFWDGKSAYTYWKNQTLGFCFQDLRAGKYKVVVTAKNRGVVPPDYPDFKVVLAGDGVAGQASIPAHAEKFKRGSTVLDLTGGDTRINLTWLNDKYKKGVYDANIEIRRVKLVRVGDSDRSALAAILMNPGRFTGAWLAIVSLLAFMAAVAAGILKRRFE